MTDETYPRPGDPGLGELNMSFTLPYLPLDDRGPFGALAGVVAVAKSIVVASVAETLKR